MRFVSFILALALAAPCLGQFKQGDWDLTLTGSGQSDKDFDNTALSGTVGVGYFAVDQMEFGLRQQLSFADVHDGSDFAGTTRVFADFHFSLGNQFVPFVGLSAGYIYGDGIDESWVGGPEGGIKFFVNESTYLYGVVGYDFDLEDGFDSGSWTYGLGIGFRF